MLGVNTVSTYKEKMDELRELEQEALQKVNDAHDELDDVRRKICDLLVEMYETR